MLPPQAAELLVGQLHDLATTDRAALGIGAIGGLLLALWSASSAVRTLMEALNVAYHEEESRGTIRSTAPRSFSPSAASSRLLLLSRSSSAYQRSSS